MSGTNVREHADEAHDSGASSSVSSSVTTTYDWANVEPTTAVVETTAAATGREPTDLDVLHEAVDTGALNAFLRSSRADGDEDLRISFDYQGCTVIARQGGRVTVYPVDG
ncbi:HalOD1 output domain-containing protein [Halobacterium wangiae]|uniref:HalOD1 output domain-containing protein n=1 Tax=Halobacterium wangiae TaxID=2902623 RepID=UPI001E292173|nr:HalOD1 output domain-containing protein [Halobacterium wangiae]